MLNSPSFTTFRAAPRPAFGSLTPPSYRRIGE
jgi:hypothetical protein